MRRRTRAILAAPLAAALLAAACGDSDASDDGAADTGGGEESSSAEGSELCPGTEGCTPTFPEGEDISIGVLSAGDTNDNGYYESFVTSAQGYADEQGWETIILDRVAQADAPEQARNLCRQGVAFIGLADGDLADAMPVAEEDVCEGVVFYINSDEEMTPFIFNTTDDIYESQMSAGVATGLVMEAQGVDSAAFIGGPDLDFVHQAFDAWTAGIQQVLPDATTSITLTGDFDDSALGQEAARAQIAAGAGLIYPYLGGATDAAAAAGAEEGVLSVAPGTDRCAEGSYAVSSLFPPGEFFLQAVQGWQDGAVTMGESLHFQVGVDDYPSVTVCDTVEGAADLQSQVDDFMAQIASGEVVPSEIVTGA